MRSKLHGILAFMLLTISIGCTQNAEPTVPPLSESLDKPVPKPQWKQQPAADPLPSTKAERNDSHKKDLQSIIPAGWDLLAKAEGDLNKDGIPDVAAVIERTRIAEDAPPRSLLIAFGNQDQSFTVVIQAEKAVLKSDEGGVYGDPFESIVIDRGSVLINFYGGSNWRWYSSYRFRYQHQGWYLIGATLGSYFDGTTLPENADEEDYNLLNGDYRIRKTDENGKTTISTGKRGIKPLVQLQDFMVAAENPQY